MATLMWLLPHPTEADVGEIVLVHDPSRHGAEVVGYELTGFDKAAGLCHFGARSYLDTSCFVIGRPGHDPVPFLNAVERGLAPSQEAIAELVVRPGFYGGYVVDEAGKPRIEKHSLAGAYRAWLGRKGLSVR